LSKSARNGLRPGVSVKHRPQETDMSARYALMIAPLPANQPKN